MSKRAKLIISAAMLLTMGACTSLTTIDGGCGSPPHSAVCLGKMKVPKKKAQYFRMASTQAIDAIASPAFRRDLEYFITRHAGTGDHAADWVGMTADSMIAGLLQGIDGVQITTMNDLVGIYKKTLFGTVAVEGNPIKFNPKNIGSNATIANSIGHEATHNKPVLGNHRHYYVGSSDRDKGIGICEPPYVVGALVQKQVEGAAWDPEGDCSLLADLITE